MQQLVNSALSRARWPMLCAAAFTAAGVYYYYYYSDVKKRGDGEENNEHARTTLTQEPVQPVSPDSALVESDLICDVDGVSVPETFSAAPAEDSLSEAEEKASSAPEDSEETKLEDRAKELEDLVLTKWRECLVTTETREQLRKAQCNMKSQYKQMQEAVTCSEELIKNLQVSLAESEEKCKQVMASQAELEEEHTFLNSDLDLLRCWVHKKEAELSRIKHACATLSSECSDERSRISELKKDLAHREASMRVLEAEIDKTERNYQEVIEQSAQLEVENSFLVFDVDLLKSWVNKCVKRQKKKKKDPAQT